MADPHEYRGDAARLRLEAAAVKDPEVRMLDIAAQYERLARSVGAIKKIPSGAGELRH